jgi:hypothetical protein
VVFEKRTFLKCPFWEKCYPVFEKSDFTRGCFGSGILLVKLGCIFFWLFYAK